MVRVCLREAGEGWGWGVNSTWSVGVGVEQEYSTWSGIGGGGQQVLHLGILEALDPLQVE